MTASDHLADFSTTDDALVLASVSSKAEFELLNDWLHAQRRAHPDTKVEVLQLPAGDPPPRWWPSSSRSSGPVRIGWWFRFGCSGFPGGLPTRVKVVGLISGRDTYRPPELLQRSILRKDPSRARIVAGEPAKVSELRQQWQDNTVGDSPRDFARFVLRRAALAIERMELRLLGPEYKSPQLITDELMASARFMEGLEKIPGASPVKAEEMLDELATGLEPILGRPDPESRAGPSSAGDSILESTTTQSKSSRCGVPWKTIRRCCCSRTGPTSTASSCRLRCRRTGCRPVHTFAGINLSFGFMGPLMRRSGVIFLRRKLDDPLYKYVLRQFVGYIVQKRFNLSWSIEGTRSRTGKMLPPKLGLLAYVADAYLDGRSEDILLQPVSISFDQLHETAEYAAYARGGEKTPEGAEWLYKFIKAQGERNYGKIYVRFPEAVSMRQYLGEPGGPIDRGPGRQTTGDAEDGVRGGLAHPCGQHRSTPLGWFRRCCSPPAAVR